jgi:hypothetical protein
MNNPLKTEKNWPYNYCWSQHEYQDRNQETQNSFKEKLAPLQRKYTMEAELEKFVLPFCLSEYIEVDYKIDSLKK